VSLGKQAYYAQIDHEFGKTLKLIAGFQANKYGAIGLNVVPRGGIVLAPAPRWSIKALYSQAFRAPSLNENLLDYPPPPQYGGPGFMGNPGLQTEKVATVDLALGYEGNRFQMEIDYFHSKQTNNIVAPDSSTGGMYLNIGETRFHGAEIEGKYYLGKHFFLMGSASYQANNDGMGHSNVTPVPNFGAEAGAGYQSRTGLAAGLFSEYAGPFHGYSSSINPNPRAYALLDAHLRMGLEKCLHTAAARGLALVVEGKNLGNQQVWLPDWKAGPGTSIFFNRGRTVFFGIEMSLKGW